MARTRKRRRRSWFASTHAIERFIGRIDTTLDVAAARAYLAELPLRGKVVLVGHQGKKDLYREIERPNRVEYVVLGRKVITVLDPQEQPLLAGREMVPCHAPGRT